MIRQITLIQYKSDTPAADIEAMGEGFATLKNIVPGIRRFQFGPDLGLEQTTLDYALVIDFDSRHDWQAYREHPQHVAFANRFMSLIARVERVQYTILP